MFERKIIFPKESPKEIYNYLVSRRVKTLVHFTPIENVKSIMENGICSLDVQEELGIYSLRTDRDRFDGLRNYNSCSISFPNYKMMAYKKRNSKFRFAVLTLDIELLKDLEYGDVVVSESNAARANSLSNSIQDLFKECAKNLRTGQKSTRKELGIVYDYYTTDPQAEVLIRNTIPPEHIKSIFIRNDDIKYAKEKGIDYKNVIWGGNSRFFSSRHDDAFWNSTNRTEDREWLLDQLF